MIDTRLDARHSDSKFCALFTVHSYIPSLNKHLLSNSTWQALCYAQVLLLIRNTQSCGREGQVNSKQSMMIKRITFMLIVSEFKSQ